MSVSRKWRWHPALLPVIAVIAGPLATGALVSCANFVRVPFVVFLSCWVLTQALDRLLGILAGWGIARTPRALYWTIARIKIRPCFGWWQRDAWSDIVVCDWVWHNPPGFDDDEQGFILKVDRMTMRVELMSIFRAFRTRDAIKVNLLLFEGLQFKTRRNRASLLNLWEALDLPDDDVNVSAIVQRAKRYGGLQGHEPSSDNGDVRNAGSALNSAERGQPVAKRFRTLLKSTSEFHQRFRNISRRIQRQVSDLGAGTAGRLGLGPGVRLRPLPPSSTEATRRAARYWKPQWGNERRMRAFYRNLAVEGAASTGCCAPLRRWLFGPRIDGEVPPGDTREEGTDAPSEAEDDFVVGSAETHCRSTSQTPRKVQTQRPRSQSDAFTSSSSEGADPGKRGYHEYPIGDPRRRPRWGVPVRFDIEQLVLLKVRFDIMELLTLESHRTLREDVVDTKMVVDSLVLCRKRLEAGDVRRRGEWDGIHGVYLGELVWVLVAEVVPLILRSSPSRILKNAFLAAGYALKDTAMRFGAGALEFALNAEHKFSHEMHEMADRLLWDPRCPTCRLRVHLVAGRRVTWKGHPVNARARLELHQMTIAKQGQDGHANHSTEETLSTSVSGGRPNEDRCEKTTPDFGSYGNCIVVDRAESALRIWTSNPRWDEHFELGPVSRSLFGDGCSLRVRVFHSRESVPIDLESHLQLDPSIGGSQVLIGEVRLPLAALLIRDQAIAKSGEIVGWFPLLSTSDAVPKSPGAELKLRLQLMLDEAG